MNTNDEIYDAEFERELRQLMAADASAAPEQLAERLFDRTVDQLTAAGIPIRMLHGATQITPPAGLADRVFDATAESLPGCRRSVIARIGWASRAAIAAAVALAAGIGIVTVTSVHHARSQAAEAKQIAWIHNELASLDRSLAAPPHHSSNPLDAQITVLAADVDQTAQAVATSPVADETTDGSTDLLNDEMMMLESQMKSF